MLRVHLFILIQQLYSLRHVWCGIAGIIVLAGCGGAKKLPDAATNWSAKLNESAVFSKSFTGFSLYDPATQTTLASYQADKYFTPASNTKLLTCYAAMRLLGDSLPALQYVVRGDSLIFWGTGDPSLLYSELGSPSKVITWLRQRPERWLLYAPEWSGEPMGPGWAWDDYQYAYSPERSAMPIHGNLATFSMKKGSTALEVVPPYFQAFAKPNDKIPTSVERGRFDNTFQYRPATTEALFEQVPFITSHQLTAQLLREATGRAVGIYWQGDQLRSRAKAVRTVYSLRTDEVLATMMQASDNFIAEQLLLLCSHQTLGYFKQADIIRLVADSLLAGSPDRYVWVDGSGLSRYNLFTPRAMVYLIDRMRTEFGEERLRNILAVGGVSGTIQNWYKADSPYLYAKTGTLRHNHCLSGLLRAKSGKTLIFSFMHNNFTTDSRPIKMEMQRILEEIRDSY